jgi:hypothetical protein
MSRPFARWSQPVQAAKDGAAQRALLRELSVWRATNLGDIPGARDATWGICRLYIGMGEAERALREARALLSLCETSPPASGDESRMARSMVRDLGGKPAPAPKRPRAERPERSDRGDRGRGDRPDRGERGGRGREQRKPVASPEAASKRARGTGEDTYREAARAGDWQRALKTLEGRRGPTSDLQRTYATLGAALDGPVTGLTDALVGLRDNLAAALRIHEPAPRRARDDRDEQAPRAPGGPATPDDPLSQLLGRRAPKRREALLRAIDEAVAQDPNRMDAVAAAALLHHLQANGPKRPAPWLIWTVARALVATEGTETRAAIAQLDQAQSYATTAYAEPSFAAALDAIRAADSAGHRVTSLRRGVLARAEPLDRKVWTLRVNPNRMMAIAPTFDTPYEDPTLPSAIVARIVELCSASVLVAPGAGNTGLREAAAHAGLARAETIAEAAELLAQLQAAPPRETQPATSPAEPPAPSAESAEQQLRALLEGEEAPTQDALNQAAQAFRRRWKLFRTAESIEKLPAGRAAALIRAVLEAQPEGAVVPEATTLAVSSAATGDEAAQALLADADVVSRMAADGIEAVAEVARNAAAAGWTIHRVIRGATRRERQDSSAVDALADSLGGLWRLAIRHGETRGEVWHLGGLAPEGRAAIPQLLLDERQRVVVLPLEPDLLAWYGGLEAPAPIGWSEDAGPALVEALASWT